VILALREFRDRRVSKAPKGCRGILVLRASRAFRVILGHKAFKVT
jgi:hypothetical protein